MYVSHSVNHSDVHAVFECMSVILMCTLHLNVLMYIHSTLNIIMSVTLMYILHCIWIYVYKSTLCTLHLEFHSLLKQLSCTGNAMWCVFVIANKLLVCNEEDIPCFRAV